jgi:hypothetical protein
MAEKNSLWKNIRNKAAQNKRTGATPKKPSAEMLRQERKIKSKQYAVGGPFDVDGGTKVLKRDDLYIAPTLPEFEVVAESPQWLKYKNEYDKTNPKSKYINKYLTPFARFIGNDENNYPKRLDDEYNTDLYSSYTDKLLNDFSFEFTDKEQELVDKYAKTERDKQLYKFLKEKEKPKNKKEDLIEYGTGLVLDTAVDQLSGELESFRGNTYADKILKLPALNKLMAAYEFLYQGRPLTAASELVKTKGSLPVDALINAAQENPTGYDIKTLEDNTIPSVRLGALKNSQIISDIGKEIVASGETKDSKWYNRHYNLPALLDAGENFNKKYGVSQNDFTEFIENYMVGRNKSYKQTLDAYEKYLQTTTNKKAEGGYMYAEGDFIDPPDGVIRFNEPTRQDSLNVLNNAIKVNNYYNNKKYKKVFEGKNDVVDAQTDIKNFNLRNDGYIQTDKGNRKLKLSDYYSNIDKNKFLMRETASSILDLRAPYSLFDKRIKPQLFNTYENTDINDSLFGDRISLYKYDPLAITPWDMLNESQRKERVKKYGKDGTPLDKNKSLNITPIPPADTRKLKPNINKIQSKRYLATSANLGNSEDMGITGDVQQIPTVSSIEEFQPSKVLLREMGNLDRNRLEGEKGLKEAYMDDGLGWRPVDYNKYKMYKEQYPGADTPQGWIQNNKKAMGGYMYAEGGDGNLPYRQPSIPMEEYQPEPLNNSNISLRRTGSNKVNLHIPEYHNEISKRLNFNPYLNVEKPEPNVDVYYGGVDANFNILNRNQNQVSLKGGVGAGAVMSPRGSEFINPQPSVGLSFTRKFNNGGYTNPYMYYSGGPMEYGRGGNFLKHLGAGAYALGEGILDTVTGGATDQLTDKGFEWLTKVGNKNMDLSDPRTAKFYNTQQQIKGYTNTAAAVGAGIVTGNVQGAIQQGVKGLNTAFQATEGLSDDFKKWSGISSQAIGIGAGIAGGALNTEGASKGASEAAAKVGEIGGKISPYVNQAVSMFGSKQQPMWQQAQAEQDRLNSTEYKTLQDFNNQQYVNQGLSFSHGGNITNNSLNLQSMKGRYQNYKQRMSKGGTFNQHGINFIPESAGLHHQSAYGGVPIGPDALAEGGEAKVQMADGGQYIVSGEVDGANTQSVNGETMTERLKRNLRPFMRGSLASNPNNKEDLKRPFDSYSEESIAQRKEEAIQETEAIKMQRDGALQYAANGGKLNRDIEKIVMEEYSAAYGGKLPNKFKGKVNMPTSYDKGGRVREFAKKILASKGGYVYNAMTQPMLAQGGPLVSNVQQPFNGPAAQNRGGMMMADGGMMQQQGGQDKVMQLIEVYANAVGVSSKEIIQQLQQMDPQEQKQAIDQMALELQGGQQQSMQQQMPPQQGMMSRGGKMSYAIGGPGRRIIGYDTDGQPIYDSARRAPATPEPNYGGDYFLNRQPSIPMEGYSSNNQTPVATPNQVQPTNMFNVRDFTNLPDEGVNSAVLSNRPVDPMQTMNLQQPLATNNVAPDLAGNVQSLSNNDFLGLDADGNPVSINPDMYYKYQTGQFTPEGATLSPDKGFFSKVADSLKGKSGADALVAAGQLAGPLSQFLQKKPKPFQYKKASATTVDPTAAIILSNEEQRRAQDTAGYNIKQNAPTSGSYLSNMRALGLGAGKQRGSTAAGIRQQYDINNAGILNQFEQYNTELENRAIDAMQQDQANFQEQRTNALYNAGANIAGMRKDYKANEINEIIANNIGTANYKLTSDGKSIVFRDVDGSYKTVPLAQVTTTPATKSEPPAINAPVEPYSGPMANYLSKNKVPDWKGYEFTDDFPVTGLDLNTGNYIEDNPNVPYLDKTDTEAIKAFQDWMDEFYPNWLDNGKSLNKGKGYGNFGDQTENAWNYNGNTFLGAAPKNAKSPVNQLYDDPTLRTLFENI